MGGAYSRGGAYFKILADRRGAYLRGGANSRISVLENVVFLIYRRYTVHFVI